MARAGEYLLVVCDVPGREVWHERLVTAADAWRPGLYSDVTPDRDNYVEELSMATVDVSGVRSLERQGTTPPGVRDAAIYRFHDVPSGASGSVPLRTRLKFPPVFPGPVVPHES